MSMTLGFVSVRPFSEDDERERERERERDGGALG